MVTIFTEKLGIQTYLVNGVRTSGRTGAKSAMLQPATLLSLVAYNFPNKNLQRLKEFSREISTSQIFESVVKNCVALFMVELLGKVLKQPEPNEDLYAFAEESLIQLNIASTVVTANFPLFFATHLTHFLGLQLGRGGFKNSGNLFFDMEDAAFTETRPQHENFVEGILAENLLLLTQITTPEFLTELRLNQHQRKELMQVLLKYYSLHLEDFGTLRSLPVLYEVFG